MSIVKGSHRSDSEIETNTKPMISSVRLTVFALVTTKRPVDSE
jgi:hypothetical protein